jgi:hypothetical protein
MKGRLMKRATCPANGGALLQVKTMMSATTSTWDGMAADVHVTPHTFSATLLVDRLIAKLSARSNGGQ